MFLPIGLECWVLLIHTKSQIQTTQRKSTLRCKWEIWPALPAKANSPNRSKILVSDHKLQSWCEPARSSKQCRSACATALCDSTLLTGSPKNAASTRMWCGYRISSKLASQRRGRFTQRKKGFPSPLGGAPNNETAKCILWLWEFHIFELCPGVVLLLLFSGKRISAAVSGLDYREFCTLETITSHCRVSVCVCVFDPAGCILFRTLLHLLLGPPNVCRLYGIRFLLAWSVLFQ